MLKFIHQSINQSINQSIYQSISQSVNQSINTSVNQFNHRTWTDCRQQWSCDWSSETAEKQHSSQQSLHDIITQLRHAHQYNRVQPQQTQPDCGQPMDNNGSGAEDVLQS